MKYKSDCFRLLNEMIECICSLKSEVILTNTFNQLRNILHKEYFTPFDREDIYMIAVCLKSLYYSVYKTDNKILIHISPYLNIIKEIISLFDYNEKNRFRNIFRSITDYYNMNKDELFLLVSDKEIQNIYDITAKCDKTIIQIEYTILKNS